MRVTNSTMVDSFLADLNVNLTEMQKTQDQLASGRNIRRPSDDPYGAVRQMQLENEVDRNNQYLENIKDSKEWMSTTDTALGQITDSLQRIRELMISSANGAKTQSDMDANKAEVLQQTEQIVQIANTQFDGKYVFSGDELTEKPFSYQGDGKISLDVAGDGKLGREISDGVVVDINMPAAEVLKGSGKAGEGLADTLSDIVAAMSSGDTASLGGDLLNRISDNIDNVVRCRGEIGAKENRMDAAQSKNEDETENITVILSGIEDVDVANKLMEYSEMEAAYEASLMTGAKVLQPSLVDFLK